MSKQIPLSSQGKNKGKYVAIVDAEDFALLSKFRWSAVLNGFTVYACRDERGTKNRVLMHREIMRPDNGQQVDHIDGDGLNNTKSNLRTCSASENSRNRRPNKGTISGLKGVRFHKASKKWHASITIDGREISLGYFDEPVDAAKAYDRAATDLHGEFARLNFAY